MVLPLVIAVLGLHQFVNSTGVTPDQNDPNVIPAPMRQQQWNLDKLGNWKTFTETTGGATITQTRAHNKVNELRSITVGPAVTDLKYDAAGNLKDDTVFHYRYDEEQRLKAVFTSVVDPLTGNRVAGDPIARYKYDALGRRILKRLLNPDGSTQLVTRFYYDGDRVVEERTGGQNLPSRQYIWGNYVDELLVNDPVDAMGNVQLTGRTYALQNSTYSIHALVNDAGTVVERYSYTPYGEVTIQNAAGAVLPASAVGNVYLFTGRELDAETGLYHFRARAYSPKFGRFLPCPRTECGRLSNRCRAAGSETTLPRPIKSPEATWAGRASPTPAKRFRTFLPRCGHVRRRRSFRTVRLVVARGRPT
jgi:RHS repeat-associated protein